MLSARLVSRATTRSFVRFYTEGATGAPRPAGSADSFNVSLLFLLFKTYVLLDFQC